MSFHYRARLVSPPDLLRTPATPLPQPAPQSPLLVRVAATWRVWRRRVRARHNLAAMDARSLRDAGISPAAAAYGSGRPFWRPIGELR